MALFGLLFLLLLLATLYYRRGLSISTSIWLRFPRILSRVMLTFANIQLYPMWKLQSGTNEDEIESLLRYLDLRV